MTDAPEVITSSPAELLAAGRRHLAVRDYSAATSALSKACELLAAEHGDTADQCAEAYLWYGKALLGLSREESGVLGDGMPGTGNTEDDDEDQEENEEEENGEAECEMNGVEDEKEKEIESTTKDEPTSSTEATEDADKPGTSNGEANDESMVDLDNEDDVDNLQLSWEMLEISRNILRRRCADSAGPSEAARALLADAHLALGEVALESETYDKAVLEMQSCLEIQKELYGSDDRRIAETHYQIGLANSLASNFEDAITHFKNAANILETRIKTLESPSGAKDDATGKKHTGADQFLSAEAEIKELKELLPEIHEKIQDMMDYKAETIKRLRETLCPSNGDGMNGAAASSSGASGSSSGSSGSSSDAAGLSTGATVSNSTQAKPASDISHLIKRKRKPSEDEHETPAKRVNT